MESASISQHEYFNIFKGLTSPVYLTDKLKLMEFIMRESNEYTTIDINILFELFDTSLPTMNRPNAKNQSIALHGEKFIISYVLSKLSEEKAAI